MNLHSTIMTQEVERNKPRITIVEFFSVEFSLNIAILTVIIDSMVNRVVETILKNELNTEGKFFVYDIVEAIDIKSK
jgi:nitrogen regulatory protein PII